MDRDDFSLLISLLSAEAENDDALDYIKYNDGYSFIVAKKTGKNLLGLSIQNRIVTRKDDADYFEAVIFLSRNASEELPDDEDALDSIMEEGKTIWREVISASTCLSLLNLSSDLIQGFRIACRAYELASKA